MLHTNLGLFKDFPLKNLSNQISTAYYKPRPLVIVKLPCQIITDLQNCLISRLGIKAGIHNICPCFNRLSIELFIHGRCHKVICICHTNIFSGCSIKSKASCSSASHIHRRIHHHNLIRKCRLAPVADIDSIIR